MNSTPGGRVAALAPPAATVRAELALGMDLTLESTRREIELVREMLVGGMQDLTNGVGEAERCDGTCTPRFREISDKVLANACRRIDALRGALATLLDSVSPGIEAVDRPSDFCGPR